MVVKKSKAAELSGVDASAANGSKTVFVKNLPWSATDDDIYAFFDGLPIYQVRLAKDYDGRPKGFGHVEFESVEAAAAAIGKSGEYFNDREVYIETTTERQQRTYCPPDVPARILSRFLSSFLSSSMTRRHHRWKFEHVLPRALLLCVGYRAASGDPIGI
jgi:RNA recognition motif-containing protein